MEPNSYAIQCGYSMSNSSKPIFESAYFITEVFQQPHIVSNFSSPLPYLFISHTSTLTPPFALQNIIVIMHFPIEPFMDFHFIQDKLQTTHHSYTLAICLNYLFRLIYSFTIYKHHSHNAHSLYCSKASSFFQLLHIIL